MRSARGLACRVEWAESDITAEDAEDGRGLQKQTTLHFAVLCVLCAYSVPDRRQVVCRVTDAGKKLLDKLDPLVDAADEATMASLSKHDLDQLITSLDRIRAANA